VGIPRYKVRVHEGHIYEWASIGRYRRIKTAPTGVAVPILPTEIMLAVEDGLFTRTHYCVKEVACPHCRAPVGKLCRNAGRPSSGTHYMRRDAALEGRRRTAAAVLKSDS